MPIDILQARQDLQSLTSDLIVGTGVSFGDKSIIIYVSDYIKENEIRNRIGDSYQGFKLRFIISGNVIAYM